MSSRCAAGASVSSVAQLLGHFVELVPENEDGHKL